MMAPHDSDDWLSARDMGYSDEELIAMDQWPWERHADDPIPEKPDLARMNERLGSYQTDTTKEATRMDKTRLIKELEATIAAAQHELAVLKSTPPEPIEHLTTIVVTFSDVAKTTYTYVALQVSPGRWEVSPGRGEVSPGRWEVTGIHFKRPSYTWKEIFQRFEAINNARVLCIRTPIKYRRDDVNPVTDES